ncbi:MAG TPA: SAM-dependent methyltransferase [Polyangiales bacterium]
MKEGQPSLTAFYVAFSRAVASHEPELARACDDHVSEHLLPATLTRLMARVRDHQPSLRLLRRAALGMTEHLALRTRLIDDAVTGGVQNGARQLVVLGAGLDARAHRMPQLADVIVFEVDHPSTQRFKRSKARAQPVLARELRYVPCNFERETFAAALAAAAFDPALPTLWIWEGVTMYLPPSVVAQSLAMISALSGVHSRLIASYLTPAPPGLRHVEALGLALLGALSEPVHSHFEPHDMATLLAAHGFFVAADYRPRAVAKRYGIRFPKLPLGAPSERIIVADKRASRAAP